eukprot:4899173-Amphidinium_carterae.1
MLRWYMYRVFSRVAPAAGHSCNRSLHQAFSNFVIQLLLQRETRDAKKKHAAIRTPFRELAPICV